MNHHEDHSHDAHTPAAAQPVKDPVGGMNPNPASAFGHTEIGGHDHYFCSAHCKQKFRADSQKYMEK